MLAIFKYLFVFALMLPTITFSLTVEEAYRLIPHEQTTYSDAKSSLDTVTKRDLDKIFKIVDEGVVARFSAFRKLYYAKPPQGTISSYKNVISKLSRLTVSKKVMPVKERILSSMRFQVQYLESWSKEQRKKATAFNSGDKLVQDASKGLREAHSDLMRLFPNESEHNKKAFFDHLCALDFL